MHDGDDSDGGGGNVGNNWIMETSFTALIYFHTSCPVCCGALLAFSIAQDWNLV